MSEIARARGLVGFKASVLATNGLMLNVFHESGLEVTTELGGGVYRVTLRFESSEPGVRLVSERRD